MAAVGTRLVVRKAAGRRVIARRKQPKFKVCQEPTDPEALAADQLLQVWDLRNFCLGQAESERDPALYCSSKFVALGIASVVIEL